MDDYFLMLSLIHAIFFSSAQHTVSEFECASILISSLNYTMKPGVSESWRNYSPF